MMETQISGETKTYCEILYPGLLFSEDETIEVKSRDAHDIAKRYKNAFAFRFYDQARTKVELDGKTQTVYGKRRNESKLYYPDGKTFTVKEIKSQLGEKEHSILISNMECNGWGKVVRTRMGNFQPFDSNKDKIIQI